MFRVEFHSFLFIYLLVSSQLFLVISGWKKKKNPTPIIIQNQASGGDEEDEIIPIVIPYHVPVKMGPKVSMAPMATKKGKDAVVQTLLNHLLHAPPTQKTPSQEPSFSPHKSNHHQQNYDHHHSHNDYHHHHDHNDHHHHHHHHDQHQNQNQIHFDHPRHKHNHAEAMHGHKPHNQNGQLGNYVGQFKMNNGKGQQQLMSNDLWLKSQLIHTKPVLNYKRPQPLISQAPAAVNIEPLRQPPFTKGSLKIGERYQDSSKLPLYVTENDLREKPAQSNGQKVKATSRLSMLPLWIPEEDMEYLSALGAGGDGGGGADVYTSGEDGLFSNSNTFGGSNCGC